MTLKWLMISMTSQDGVVWKEGLVKTEFQFYPLKNRMRVQVLCLAH